MSDDPQVDVWMPPHPAALRMPGWRARDLLVEWAALPAPVETVLDAILGAGPPEQWDAAFQARLPSSVRMPLAKVFSDRQVRAAWFEWSGENLTRRHYGWLVGMAVWSAIQDPGGKLAEVARNDWIAAHEADERRRAQLANQQPIPKPVLEPLDDADGIVRWHKLKDL